MRKCPIDNTKLYKDAKAGITIDRCGHCHGIWFDAGELEKMKRIEEPYIKWLPFDLFGDKEKLAASDSGKHCPKDGGNMRRISYGSSNINVDICARCKGIWLDKGEYKALCDDLHKRVNRTDIAGFLKALGREVGQVAQGRELFSEAVSDILMIAKLLEYKILSQWPYLVNVIRSIPS